MIRSIGFPRGDPEFEYRWETTCVHEMELTVECIYRETYFQVT